MKKINSLTTTSVMEACQQIGKQLSVTGSDELMNIESKKKLEQDILQQVPEKFRIGGIESLQLRSQEIENHLGIRNDFQINKAIDDTVADFLITLNSEMEPCSREDIAISLETIASTFQVKVPDELGLTVYFDILEMYPKFIINRCTRHITKTYPYPRLPVPKDFVEYCDPIYKTHKDWLLRVAKNFYRLEISKQSPTPLPYINKYLNKE